MADWDLQALLLRGIDFKLAGANWQRSGGKSPKPQPIPLPDAKGRGSPPTAGKPVGADAAQKLKNLGLLPPGTAIR